MKLPLGVVVRTRVIGPSSLTQIHLLMRTLKSFYNLLNNLFLLCFQRQIFLLGHLQTVNISSYLLLLLFIIYSL